MANIVWTSMMAAFITYVGYSIYEMHHLRKTPGVNIEFKVRNNSPKPGTSRANTASIGFTYPVSSSFRTSSLWATSAAARPCSQFGRAFSLVATRPRLVYPYFRALPRFCWVGCVTDNP